MNTGELIEYINNYTCSTQEELLLEKSYENSMMWENDLDILEKGGVAAPIGTVRMVSGGEYIKTPQGWRYHSTTHRKAAQEHYTSKGKATPAHLTGDIKDYRKNSGGHVSFSVKEGSTLEAKDGTKGSVISHDGRNVGIKFKGKNGEEQTVKVDATKLEHNVSSGGVKHTPTKDSKANDTDSNHEDHDDNIKAAAENEKRQGNVRVKSNTPSKPKGKVDELVRAQGLDPKDYPDIMEAEGLSDGEKLQLIMIRNEIGGKGNKKGSISKKDEVKKADIYNGGLNAIRCELIKSNFKENDI